jgi:ElaB/YqjD/DUF883 family membrane-anchored ribosome-binding protein
MRSPRECERLYDAVSRGLKRRAGESLLEAARRFRRRGTPAQRLAAKCLTMAPVGSSPWDGIARAAAVLQLMK